MTITREQAYQELFGSDSAQTANSPQSGGFSREQAYQELFGNDGTVQPNSAGTNDTNSGLFNLPKNSTPFFPSANAVGDVTGIIVDAFGHTVNAVEQLTSPFYRATDTGIALKRWFGDDSDKPNLYGKAIIDFSKNNLHSDEYNRQVEQGQANSAAIEQQLNQQKRAGTISEAEAFATDAIASARNLFENPALLGQGLSTAIPSLATLALTKSPAAAATVGAGMGGAEVLENNQHFIDSVPQTLLSQSPVYQTLIQKGLSDGEARYYLANDLTEHGWHVAAAGGSEAVLDRLMFGKFLKPTGSVAKTTLQSGAMEGGQEVVQNTVSNDAVIRLAERLGIPTNKMRSDGAGNAFVLGSATGMAMGGGSALLNSGANPKTDSEQFNREIAESSQETSEQATRTEVDRTKLKEAFAPFAESLDENEYEALWQELVTDIEQGDLSEAMASEDREYATIARAYAQAVGFEAQNANSAFDETAFNKAIESVAEDDRDIFKARLERDIANGNLANRTGNGKYDRFVRDYLALNQVPEVVRQAEQQTEQGEVASEIQGQQFQVGVENYGSANVNYRNPEQLVNFTEEQKQAINQVAVENAELGKLSEKIKQQYPNTSDEHLMMLLHTQPVYQYQQKRVANALQQAENLGVKWVDGQPIKQIEQGTAYQEERIQPEMSSHFGVGKPNKLSQKQWSLMQDYVKANKILTDLVTHKKAQVKNGEINNFINDPDYVQALDLAINARKLMFDSGVTLAQLNKNAVMADESTNPVVQAKSKISYQQQFPEQGGSTNRINQQIDVTQNGKFTQTSTTTSEALLREAGLRFSRNNQPKNASENIARGRQAMEFAIENQTDVANAMYREGLGWVDFIWGSVGKIKPNNKTKGGQGISHIIEARMRKDHYSNDEAVNMLKNEIVNVIALGSEKQRSYNEKQKETRLTLEHAEHEVILVKPDESNGWIISGYKQKSADGQRVGFDTTEPTHSKPTLARQGMGAAEMSLANTPGVETVSELDGNKVSLGENQEMNQSRGATTSDLRSTDPIRSRIDEVALGSNNVRPTTQDVNSSPEIQQAKTILEKALGKAYAEQVNFVRSSDFNDGRATAEGFFQNGKVYIVADNIHSTNAMNKAERMVWVGWHEMAHNGIDVKLGGIYKNAMEQARKNVVVDRIAKAIEQEYQNQGITRNSKHYFTEEAIAELYSAFKTGNWAEIENRYGLKVPQTWTTGTSSGKLKSLLESVIRVVRNIASKITGKDLRKTSDSEIIGLLKQVDNAVHSLAENSENQTAYNAESRYSLNESADSAFAKAVDEVANGQQAEQKIINVGTTPDVLKMLGLPDVSVIIHANTLSKVMHDKHSVAPEVLKAIPAQINNPVAVMKSETQPNGYVVLTELVEQENGKDKPVIAALHLKQDKNGLELINIASVYGRSNSQIQRGLENDLLYWNNEKGAKFLDNFTLQLRSSLSENSSIGGDIKTEADLSQYQAENSARYSRKPQELSKSATDNNGEFSAENDDIHYSRRPKSESLEKLRKAETIRITGTEIKPSEDLRQYKRNALEYGKSLRGAYVNKDTGRKIELGAGGVKEVLQHDYKNPDHLQSIAAIPQIIEQATYIDTLPNEETDKNFAIDEYEYYVAGLNIGGTDYTVKAVVGVSKDGDRYYDHKLSEIEKGDLLSLPSRITNPVGENNSPLSEIDDKRLLQILQDENADNAKFSRRPSVLDQIQNGEVNRENSALWQDLKQGNLKNIYRRAEDFVQQQMQDETLPVDKWAQATFDPVIARNLISAKDRAQNIRMDLNGRVSQKYITPLFKNISDLAKKYDLDLEFAQHITQYWYSARYSIEKNQEILDREKQAWKEAQQALADAQQKGDPDEISRAARAERRAKKQYNDRLHDANLTDWTKDANGEYIVKRRVGTAGGWSFAHAKAIMTAAERYIPAQDIEQAMVPLKEAVRWNIWENFRVGRITDAQKTEYLRKPNYVPLTGDPYSVLDTANSEDDFIGGAGGKNVNTSRDHTMDGRRESEADGAVDAIMGMLDKTNANSAWSEFKNIIDDVYETAYQTHIANGMTQVEARKEAQRETGISKQRLQAGTRTSDKVLIRKMGGVSYEYRLPDSVINALQKSTQETDGAQAWAFVTAPFKTVTSWLARGVTQFNPAFALTNFISDIQDKATLIIAEDVFVNGRKLSGGEMTKISGAVLKNAALSFKATGKFGFKGTEGLNMNNKMERNLKRLIELGGISNYSTYLAKTKESLRDEIKRIHKPHLKSLDGALKTVAAYNATFDYVSSLATYTALTDAGVDEKQAATVTLNLMNFRKQGEFAKYLKPFYMFINPAIQGNAKTLRLLKTNRGRAVFAVNVVKSMALYAFIAALADDDELGNTLMSNPFYPREIQIPLFGNETLRIPLGFGVQQLSWVIGANIVKAGSGQISYGEAVGNILGASTKAVAPITPSEISPTKSPLGWLVNTFSPQLLKPFLQLWSNRNSFGSPIVSEGGNSKLPKALQGKTETAETWKTLAQDIYDITGLDTQPEVYKHLFDSHQGMLGAFGQYLSNQIENPALEMRGKRERTLILDRFYRDLGNNKVQNYYYQAKEEAEDLLKEMEYAKESGKLAEWRKPEKIARIRWYKRGEEKLRELYQQKSALEKQRRADRIRGTNRLSDERFSERVKLINSRIEKVQRQQIHEWRKMEGLRTTLPK